jgi:hypothetical protein
MAVISLPLAAALIALLTVWYRGRRARARKTDLRATIPWR